MSSISEPRSSVLSPRTLALSAVLATWAMGICAGATPIVDVKVIARTGSPLMAAGTDKPTGDIESLNFLQSSWFGGPYLGIRVQESLQDVGQWDNFRWTPEGWQKLGPRLGEITLDGIKYRQGSDATFGSDGAAIAVFAPDMAAVHPERAAPVVVWTAHDAPRSLKSPLEFQGHPVTHYVRSLAFVSPDVIAWNAQAGGNTPDAVYVATSAGDVRELLRDGKSPSGVAADLAPHGLGSARLISNHKGQLLVVPGGGGNGFLWDSTSDSIRSVQMKQEGHDVYGEVGSEQLLDDGSVLWSAPSGQWGGSVVVRKISPSGAESVVIESFDSNKDDDSAPQYTPILGTDRENGMQVRRAFWCNASGSRVCFTLQEHYLDPTGRNFDLARERSGVYTGAVNGVHPILRVRDQDGSAHGEVVGIDGVVVQKNGGVWLWGSAASPTGNAMVAVWYWNESGGLVRVSNEALDHDPTLGDGLAVDAIWSVGELASVTDAGVCVLAKLQGGGEIAFLMTAQ